MKQLKAFARFLDDHEAMVAAGMPADAILTSVLDRSGYLADLHNSTDPQDETRLENLKELITVAREFVTGVATLTVPEEELDDFGLPGESDAPPEGDLAAVLDPEADLAAGAAEPDASLGAFLERVALVADSDQIPPAPDEVDAGIVTLMTLHTAKGLEFDTVFLTGCEDGVFPHQRAIAERTGNELAEERRLAYVGITRARKRLYISRAIARLSWGSPQHNPPSRFLGRAAEPARRLAAYGGCGHELAKHFRAQPPRPGGMLSATARSRPSARSLRWWPETECCTPRSAWAQLLQPPAKATRQWPMWTLGPQDSNGCPCDMHRSRSSSS